MIGYRTTQLCHINMMISVAELQGGTPRWNPENSNVPAILVTWRYINGEIFFHSIRICREGALYRSHGSGRLLTQSTIVVFWPSWYRPALGLLFVDPAHGSSHAFCSHMSLRDSYLYLSCSSSSYCVIGCTDVSDIVNIVL